jgi:pimeloyl-ACP methyl ester carboxylesterase
VRAGSVPLRVVRAGEGPPLLLINGLGASVEMWRPLVRELPDRELVALDLPGTGQSGRPRWPMRMPQLAGAVTAVLDDLGLDRVDLLGYSLGGVVAQELARRAPERVDRLILAATTPGLPSIPPNPLVAMLMLSPARYYDRRLAEAIVPRIAGGRTARDRRVLRARLGERLADPPTPIGYLHQLCSVWGWSGHLHLPRLRMPTLVLHGSEDPLVPVLNARYMARVIPDATLRIIEHGGHLILFDEPAATAEAITGFLTTQTR